MSGYDPGILQEGEHDQRRNLHLFIVAMGMKCNLKTTWLKEGLHQYLVYFENPKKKMIAGHSLWNRQVADNIKKGFELVLSNLPMDPEVFNTLPIKKVGQRFIINFYHPGGSAPKFYEYKVIADEKLKTQEGRQMDCWQIKIDYSETNWAIFWISKKSNEVIKMQEYFRDMYRYKIRVATPVAQTKE